MCAQAAMAQQKRAGGAGLTGREAPSNSGTTFDLGTSLLGPSEVARAAPATER